MMYNYNINQFKIYNEYCLDQLLLFIKKLEFDIVFLVIYKNSY